MTILVSHQAVPSTLYNKIAPMAEAINDFLLEDIRTEWINTTSNAQPRNPLWIDKQKTQQIRHLTAEANHAIHMMHAKNIAETNTLIYATAKVTTRHTPTQKNSQNKHSEFHTTMEKKARKQNHKTEKRHQQNGEW